MGKYKDKSAIIRRRRKKKGTSESDLEPPPIPRVSAIQGDNHDWFKGITGVHKKHFRYTEYACRKCHQWFRHLFELIPDVFNAMERVGIMEKCK